MSKRQLVLCVIVAFFVVPAPPLLAQQTPLAATPPMGWNSWNRYACDVSDTLIRKQADAMVSSGLKAAGYQYVNVDDCWEGQRDANGYIQPNEKFPDMKGLGDYIHSKGLKFGIYSSPGPKTCDHHEGSYGHEQQDAESYAKWGVDYLKYDWCSARDVYKPPEYPEAFRKMHDALVRTGRPIVYSIHGRGPVWEWAAKSGANLWRTTGDIKDNYARMIAIASAQSGLEQYAGPGHWNDPDMLEVGNGGMKDNEYRMHMTMWCLLAAPLLAGNDLTQMTPATLAILANREAIAVDQDGLGVQARRVLQIGPVEVWVKPLHDGSKAVGLFNREQGVVPVKISLKELGLGSHANVRDLWEHKDLPAVADTLSADVGEHSAVFLKLR
ncbi:MAG TPA: glycoside hydrolase family 27 protein [Bryobacteraceae bacterium]|nr:glycoside hydrolase family 27 protein [Bryobacteraceae bacterium]